MKSRADFPPKVKGIGGADISHGPRVLHRLAEVRKTQKLALSTIARRLGIEVEEVKRREKPTYDMLLSELLEWREALDVPIEELFVEPSDELAKPLLQRAQLVRLMKTAKAILELVGDDADLLLMAQTLVDLLAEAMPELLYVGAWHVAGRRRGLSDLGIAAERTMSYEDLFGSRD